MSTAGSTPSVHEAGAMPGAKRLVPYSLRERTVPDFRRWACLMTPQVAQETLIRARCPLPLTSHHRVATLLPLAVSTCRRPGRFLPLDRCPHLDTSPLPARQVPATDRLTGGTKAAGTKAGDTGRPLTGLPTTGTTRARAGPNSPTTAPAS